ncbi:hypothetical protein BRD17_05700 [Halobacteriales archaeon SW_7_68_16]|nr:MAG: hypothetical protein BRD17_05700 [Halobacteriales archaeon SW_7_68_16]
MPSVYAGPDGRFLTERQLRRRVADSDWTVAIAYDGGFVLSDPEGRATWFVAVPETRLPEGVRVEGDEVRDDRDELEQ